MKKDEWFDSLRIHAFFCFNSLLYMNSDLSICIIFIIFTVTYVTILLQL